jgi:hypothetical protein
LIHSLLYLPHTGDCEGCRIRSRDCCVSSLDLPVSTEPPQPRLSHHNPTEPPQPQIILQILEVHSLWHVQHLGSKRPETFKVQGRNITAHFPKLRWRLNKDLNLEDLMAFAQISDSGIL